MQHPLDSVLEAAKKTAEALRLPWPEVQKIYRSLQEDDPATHSGWIPKSKGRTIWYAHPNFIGRIISAYSLSGGDFSYHNAVTLTHGLALEGRNFQFGYPASGMVAPFEGQMASYLCNTQSASKLRRIEFSLSEKEVTFVEEGRRLRFIVKECPRVITGNATLFEQAIHEVQNKPFSQRVSRTVVVDAAAIQELSETVNWRHDSIQPFGVSEHIQGA